MPRDASVRLRWTGLAPSPRDPEAYAVRSVVHELKGDVQGAIRDAVKAIETAPRSWPKRAAVVAWLEDLRRRK